MRIMSTGFNNCQVIEAIQNLSSELREMIYKHYLAIKLRERAVLGWDLVHDELSIQPFCPVKAAACPYSGVCSLYALLFWMGVVTLVINKTEILHELTISVPINGYNV